MKYSALVLAAGKGSRIELGYNKVLYAKDGVRVIDRSLSLFLEDEDCEAIILTVSDGELEEFQMSLTSTKIVFALGGETRQESVYHGLKLVQSDYVMIQDGARPFLAKQELDMLKETLATEKACLLMVPVIDTIKKVKDGYVVETPIRSDYFAAQTPQCFSRKLIQACYEKAHEQGYVASDDAQLVEKYSDIKIKVILGSYANKKITTKEDLKW